MKFLNWHISDLPPEREKFDTLISPSGTVATLSKIAKDQGVDYMAFDSAFPDSKNVAKAVREEIEKGLLADQTPVLLCTTLVYNAEATLLEAKSLRCDFGDKIKIVLGGQLVPFARNAYLSHPAIDAVGMGDAEVILPKIIKDFQAGVLRGEYTDWLKVGKNPGKFAFVDYENFFMLEERMQAQRELSGFSQLCIQGLGGPGCSWAAGNKKGACDFCALQNITEMNTRSLGDQMEAERALQERFHPDRFFDVANQFLPSIRPKENEAWLRNYIRIRNEKGVVTSKYAYLTVASINAEIAELLKEAGIVEVYLGVDHFDAGALKEENKSHRTQRQLDEALQTLRRVGIKVRMGIVVGSACETNETLQSLQEGVRWLKDNYKEMIKALGVFPIYVLPGSKVYERVRQMPEAQPIISRFEREGFFLEEDQVALSDLYMRSHSEVELEAIREAIGHLQHAAAEFTVSYDYNHSPGPEVLNV